MARPRHGYGIVHEVLVLSAGSMRLGAGTLYGLLEKAQLWMRAYPRRWRAARGAELLGVVVDLAGPGARQLRVGTVVDLVRGGWATRWRERPPLHVWLGYRFLGLRIPSAYRAWALDDIDGRGYLLRDQPVTLAILASGWVTAPARWWWGLLAAAFVPILLSGPRRDRARIRHLAPDPGEVLREGGLVAYPRPVRRVTAHAALRAMEQFLALMLGRGARRRLDRLEPRLPPNRAGSCAPCRCSPAPSSPSGEPASWSSGRSR